MLIASVGLGCKFMGGSSSGGNGSGTSGGAGGGLSGGSDPKGDLIAASKKLVELKSFSGKMQGKSIVNGVENEMKQQVDYVAPDRYHVIYQGGTGAGMEIIYVGGDMYMKPAGGKWSKTPGGGANMPTLRDSFTDEGVKSLSDAKYEGEETVNGKAALVYSYKNVTPKGDFPFSTKMYVDKATGVPLRTVTQFSNGVLKEMTVDYDTTTPVTIEPPAA